MKTVTVEKGKNYILVHLDFLEVDNLKYIFVPGLFLISSLEEGKLLSFIDEKLGIDVYAYTLDELFSALKAEIDMLWHNYALKDNNELTAKAQELKENLQKRITVISK